MLTVGKSGSRKMVAGSGVEDEWLSKLKDPIRPWARRKVIEVKASVETAPKEPGATENGTK